MDDAGLVLGKITPYENNRPGAEQLEKDLVTLATEHGITQMRIGVEATSYYHLHLMDYLATSSQLKPFDPLLYQFNPKWIRHFKKSYSDRDKTDPDDAFVIADRLRFGRLPAPYQEQQRNYLPLQRLTRFRFHLVDQLVREKNHFLLHLFLKFSSFGELKPFANTLGATASQVITELSPDQIAQMPLEDLVTFIRTHGRNRFPDPARVAETLRQVVHNSYRLRPALAKSVDLVLASSCKNIRLLEKSIHDLDKTIAAEAEPFAEYAILDSIPGIGPVYAAGLLSEIGGISRFASQAALAKFTGLWWKRSQSGDFEAEITRLAKSGNKYLRYYLVEAAGSVKRQLASFQRYYERKYREVPKFQHQRALVMTARKLLRLVFALLREDRLFRLEGVGQGQGGTH
jgi:transposase